MYLSIEICLLEDKNLSNLLFIAFVFSQRIIECYKHVKLRSFLTSHNMKNQPSLLFLFEYYAYRIIIDPKKNEYSAILQDSNASELKHE